MGSDEERVDVNDIVQNVYDKTTETVRIEIQNGLKYEEVTVDAVDYYIIEIAVTGFKLFAIKKSDRSIVSLGSILDGHTELI